MRKNVTQQLCSYRSVTQTGQGDEQSKHHEEPDAIKNQRKEVPRLGLDAMAHENCAARGWEAEKRCPSCESQRL